MDKESKEFIAFLAAHGETPKQQEEAILDTVKSALTPSFNRAAARLLLLQLVSGLLTLLVCPQAGIGPIGGGHGISHVFMEIGVWACAIFCATFYFGVSLALALTFLDYGSLHIIGQRNFVTVLLILSFSVLLIMPIGYLINANSMFFATEFLLIWIATGIVTLFAGIKLGLSVRLGLPKA